MLDRQMSIAISQTQRSDIRLKNKTVQFCVRYLVGVTIDVRGQNPKHPILIPLAEWRPSDVPVFPPTPTNYQWTTATSDTH